MALSLLPQPRSIKTLVGFFDFKEVDTIFLSKRASRRIKMWADLLAREMKQLHHLDYRIQEADSVKDPCGCLITHHTREGVFVKTALQKPQAYELLAAGHSLSVSASDEGGFFASTRTVRELLQDGTRIPALKIQDWPVVPFRAIHLDLKGLTPNAQTLKEFVELVSLYKFNVLLVEYEDRFPFECLPEVRGAHAFTPQTLKEFLDDAELHGLEVIPLVQTLGHWEYILRHPQYRELGEVPEVPQQLCPAHPKAQKLVREMVREIVRAHPRSRYIHLGADEAWQMGQNPLTKSMAQKTGGKQRLFLDHVSKLIRAVQAAGKQAMIWDDMLRELPAELLKKLPKGTALAYWNYRSHGGQFKAEMLPHLGAYRAAGFKVFGTSAIKGADGFCSSAPHYRQRMDNVDWWVEAAETSGPLAGLIATAWARYNSNLTPCDPLPVIWPSALYAAERAWTGLGSSRESFERRLLADFYGLRPEMTEVASAHYGLAEEHAVEAGEVLGQAKRSARRNRDVLELLELFAQLEVLTLQRKQLFERVAGLLPSLEQGRADPSKARELKSQVPVLAKELDRLRKELARVLLKRFHKDEVEEFIQDRLLVCERLLSHLDNLLKRN